MQEGVLTKREGASLQNRIPLWKFWEGGGIPNGTQVSTERDTGYAGLGNTLPPKRNTGLSQTGGTNSYTSTKISDIDFNPINQSESEQFKSPTDTTDAMDNANAYIALIKENIEYEHHMKYDKWQEKALYDELFDIICEVVCVKRETVRIGKEDYPYELVKSKFLKLDSSHLEYVISRMRETTTKISNIKSYMITALYNAPSTINHFYQQEVQHDMYGGGWHEKGIV